MLVPGVFPTALPAAPIQGLAAGVESSLDHLLVGFVLLALVLSLAGFARRFRLVWAQLSRIQATTRMARAEHEQTRESGGHGSTHDKEQ